MESDGHVGIAFLLLGHVLPALFGRKGITQIQYMPRLTVPHPLPIARVAAVVACKSSDAFPAQTGSSHGGWVSHRMLDVVYTRDVVSQHPGAIQGGKDPSVAELDEARVDFKKLLP